MLYTDLVVSHHSHFHDLRCNATVPHLTVRPPGPCRHLLLRPAAGPAVRPVRPARYRQHTVLVRALVLPVRNTHTVSIQYVGTRQCLCVGISTPPRASLFSPSNACLRVSIPISRYISSFSKGAILAEGGNTGSVVYDFFIGR